MGGAQTLPTTSYSSGNSCISTKPVYNTSSVAGFRTVDRHKIAKEESVEKLYAQLVSLVGENGAEMLISALRNRRSISGPELAGCIHITPKSYNAAFP